MKEFIKEALPKGTMLNGKYSYLIEEPLGQGSFGITYRARVILNGEFGSLETQGYVAIKEFFMKDLNGRKEYTLSTGSDSALFCSYLEKFRKEAVNLSNLHHPGIVKVTESFTSNSTSYYVMEYISGGTLDEEIHRVGKFCFEQAYPLIADICDALGYMHEQGMLHLDLKPSNVMLDSQKHPKLIDFGLSKHYNEGGEVETTTSIGLGTPGYAPIEQIGMSSKNSLCTTMDVYALGGILFKMLTGLTPPPAIEFINHQQKLREFLKTAGIKECIITLLEHCMHPFKDQRIQSISHFKKELDECYSVLAQEHSTLFVDEDIVTSKDSQSCKDNNEGTSFPEQCTAENGVDENPNTSEDNDFGQVNVVEDEEILQKGINVEKESLSVKTGNLSIRGGKRATFYHKIKWVSIPIIIILAYYLLEVCSLYIRYDSFYGASGYIHVHDNNKEGLCNFWGFELIPPIYDDISNIKRNLHRVRLDNNYGLIDDNGKFITEIIYEAITPFCKENLISVRMNSKSGYIDPTGKMVIPFIYSQIEPFSEGLSAVQKDGKWGYINPMGETVIPFIYDSADRFKKGFAQVKRDGKWGRIDLSGNEVVKPVYEKMESYFSYGYNEVKRDGKYGFINEDWKETVPTIYDKIGAHNQLYASVKRDGKWGRVELSSGNEVVKPIYEDLGEYNYDNNRRLAKIRLHGKVGYIDENWNEVIKPIYDDISYWHANINEVEIDGKYGLIDKDFNEVLPTIYDNIYSLWGANQKYAKIQLNGKWGLIDRNGEVIIKPIYDDVVDGNEQLIAACIEGQYGYIDRAGKTIIPFIYDKAQAFSNGLGNVKKDGFWGAINKKNELIIPLNNDSITSMSGGYARIMRNWKWGRIDSTGTVIVQPVYDEIIDYHKSATHIKRDGKWGCMDLNWNILVEPVYDEILSFSDSCFRARRNGYWGIVDRNLSEKTEFVYYSIGSLDRQYHLAKICKDKNVWGLIDADLDIVVNIEYDKIIQNKDYYLLYNDSKHYPYIYLAEDRKLITNRDSIYNITGYKNELRMKQDFW